MIVEEDILDLLRAKDYRVAFERLLDRMQTRIFHLALALLREEAWAKDATQDCFLKVWRGLSGYAGDSSLSTWVYAIARNTCYTEVRKRSSRPAVSLEDPGIAELVDQASDEPPAGFPTDRRLTLELVISRLPDNQRVVLRLFYFEEKSYEEVAEIMGIPLGTVKTHLYRAKRELLNALQKGKHYDLRPV